MKVVEYWGTFITSGRNRQPHSSSPNVYKLISIY